MTTILDRDFVRSPISGTQVGGEQTSVSLPPELVAAAGRRLAEAALIYASIYVIQYVVTDLVMTLGPMHGDAPAPWGLLTIIFSGVSLATAWVALRVPLPLGRIQDLGLFFMVTATIGIEVGLLFVPADTPIGMLGLSWTVVWLAIFPLVVPTTAGKTLVAALVSAALRPLLVLVLVARGRDMPSSAEWIMVMFPQAIGVCLAVVGSRIVYEMARDVSRARQMGSYRLLEPLGRGGMGEVWRAEHGLLARPAAIKLIRPEALGQAEPEARRNLLKRFEREAQATAVLSSPHTVQIYDYGVTSDSTFYYVMELLHGLDSDQLVQRFGPLPPARVVHLLSQVCDSLAEAHQKGLVHRDIKPANVYLCKRGLLFDYVKVLDFGLVKAAAGSGRAETVLTQQQVATGTPAFMAPEVALAEQTVDGRADLYAVGCLGYWLLTGRLVFDADNAIQMMVAHAQRPPEPPSRHTEQPIPAALDELLLACLAKSPQARPQTADDLRRRLERLEETHGKDDDHHRVAV